MCRFCSAQQTQPPPRRIPTATTATILTIFAVVALVALTSTCSRSSPPEQTTPAPAVIETPPLSAAQTKGCKDAINKAIAEKAIRRWPQPNRIDVDDIVWRLTDAEDKKAMLALVGCASFKKQSGNFTFDEYVVAYGARSGKRLAMLSSVGFSFE